MALYKEVDSSLALIGWIKRKLGSPTINIEIEDQSIQDNINDALQWYGRYSSDSKYRNALVFQVSAGVDTYQLPDYVESVLSLDTTYSFGGSITTLFTVENILYNEGMLAGASPMELVTWELAQEYLSLLRDRLVAKFQIHFNKFSKQLKIIPKPTLPMGAVLTCYTTWDQPIKSSIYNEFWVKRYSLALTKITLGTIWGKYQGMPIPGGGSLNGADLRSEGISERDNLENDIIDLEGEPLGVYFGDNT